MTMAKAEITVGIESVIHSVLTDVVQRIADQHGIRVDGVEVDWLDVSTPADNRFMVRKIYIRSNSSGGNKSPQDPT